MTTVSVGDKTISFPDGMSVEEIQDVVSTYTRAAADVGATITSGAIAEPVSGWTALLTGDPDAVEGMKSRMTYQPKTEMGKRALHAIGNTIQLATQKLGLDHMPGYWRDRVIPSLQEEAGTVVGSALGAGSLAALVGLMEMGGGGRTRGLGHYQSGGVGSDKSDKDMMFLHNTSPAAIESFDEIGGIPMPSLAVTKEDVPFDSFGEVTLVGKPEAFDPRASRTNDLFSSDAYTVRAPRPFQFARKDADKIFEERFGTALELDKEADIYASDMAFELAEQGLKSRASTESYNRIKDFFLRPDAKKLFALDKGYAKADLPKRDDSVEIKKQKMDKLNAFVDEHEDLEEWRYQQISDLLEPEKVFVSKTVQETDYKPRRQVIKPYTADEVTKFMRRSSGANQEGGFTSGSVGAQRASTAELIGSLKQAKEKKSAIQRKEAVDELKDAQSQKFFSIADALEKHYIYPSTVAGGGSRFGYLDEVGELIKMSERMGLERAFDTIGFKNVPDELWGEINDYKDSLRNAPTQYFESKPRRTVSLSEFGGAIVPEGTEPKIKQILEKHGITNIQTYKSGTTERENARKAFQDLMFSVGLPAVVAGELIYSRQENDEQI